MILGVALLYVRWVSNDKAADAPGAATSFLGLEYVGAADFVHICPKSTDVLCEGSFSASRIVHLLLHKYVVVNLLLHKYVVTVYLYEVNAPVVLCECSDHFVLLCAIAERVSTSCSILLVCISSRVPRTGPFSLFQTCFRF